MYVKNGITYVSIFPLLFLTDFLKFAFKLTLSFLSGAQAGMIFCILMLFLW